MAFKTHKKCGRRDFPLGFDTKKSTPGTRIPPATHATIATLIATLFDGVMDSNHGRTDTNIHKVAQIGEYCGGIPKGTVRAGINVGSCAGGKAVDAYTGWNFVTRIMIEEVSLTFLL